MTKIAVSTLSYIFFAVVLSACASEKFYREVVFMDGVEVEYSIRYFQDISEDEVSVVINELKVAGKMNGFIRSIFKYNEKYVVQFVSELSKLSIANPVGLSGKQLHLFENSEGWVIEDAGSWIQ